MQESYKRSFLEKGRGIHSRVYSIEGKNSKREYIVKIYEEAKFQYYKNETYILDNLNNIYPDQGENNNGFIMYRDMNYTPGMFEIPKEIRGNNLQFLFYDYLQKFDLLEYLDYSKYKIKEIHAKFICYKILKALEQLHSINICHNALKESKVMFDNNLNLKLIHFSEAKMIIDDKEGVKLNKDIFDLGQILAKIFSQGKFKSINYHKKQNIYIIFTNIPSNKSKKLDYMKESQFWEMLSKTYGINVPQDFLKFFKVLIYSKMSNAITEIDSLLKNEWLKEITNDIPKYEGIFKQDFNELYNTIFEIKPKNNYSKTDIDNMLDEYENEVYTEENDIEPPKDYIDIINKENIKGKNEEININQINNDFNKLSMNDKNMFIPGKDDINYLKIDVMNPKNKDIDKAMLNFMKDLKYNIRENYEDTNISINFKENKDESFIIEYGIPAIKLDYDDIIFLDENFENKVKNGQNFEIKVKLFEGDKSLFDKQKINQFYLVFEGNNIDYEDFYEFVKTLKNIAKKMLDNE